MTNDYYINLANYYTNQLVVSMPSESITLNEPYTNLGLDTFLTNIATAMGDSGYVVQGNLTWSGSNNIILYGYLKDSNNDFSHSFIVRLNYINGTYDIVNADGYVQYIGGTYLPQFVELKVDNDGSVYGMAQDSTGFKLLMIANPFIRDGIKFRQSYSIPATYSSYTNYQKLIKKENTGEYLFILNNGSNSTLVLHLTIIIGDTNEWVASTYASSVTVYDYLITWGEYIYLDLLTNGSNATLFYILHYDGSSITQTITFTKASNESTMSAKFYNYQTIYYINSYLYSGNAINVLYKGDLGNNTNTIVKSTSTPYSTSDPTLFTLQLRRRQQVQVVDGLVYFSYWISDGGGTGNDLFGVIAKGNVYTTTSSISISATDLIYFFVQNTFNIHKIITPLKNYLDIVEFQYDPNGYNGSPYTDINFFIPYKVELYDDDVPALLLFDRGLYNLKVYNNVCESTFNVPYTMLNSETIQQAKLYGETNYNLVDSYINVTKNIYENLMINFFNSIVVNDYTGRIYNDGGARVNDSISKTNDMTSASVRKIKAFYSDSTSYTYLLPAPTITGVGNPMTITYEIPLYVASDGYVLKYQLLSNDENTLYFEYDTSSLNAGTYKITQECKIK